MDIASNVDEYISGFPTDQQDVLQKVRSVISENVPGAVERIAYGMPTFSLPQGKKNRNVIHFAAMKNHLGIYPGGELVAEWAERLAGYTTAKGTIQFPWSDPIDYDLIAEIARYRYAKESA